MAQRQLARSVSIIGVGITRFGDADDPDTPELKGMSPQDMAVWACTDAMEDAGVNPRDIDKLIFGMVSSTDGNSDCIAPNHGFLEYIGMHGKAGAHQSEACATPFDALNEAVLEVASGRYDIAMVVDVDSARHISAPNKPSCYRYPKSQYRELFGRDAPTGDSCQDTAISRWVGGAAFDTAGRRYIREAGITAQDLDDALCGQAITLRHHGAMNPKAYARKTWEDVAHERGFDDVHEFMQSRFAPKITEYLRTTTFSPLSEGAAAIIVCATERAGEFRQKPIEVVNLAQVDMGLGTAQLTPEMTRAVAKQIYEVTGYGPDDIEYFQTTDGDLIDALDSAEACGYLPKGEGWKYFRDGKTAFDAEKPMCTDGGHQCYGHAYGATALATVGECVYQMRGQAGERQIKQVPKLSLMRGWGAGQSVSAYILRGDGIAQEAAPAGEHLEPETLVLKFYEGLEQGKFLGRRCAQCGNVQFPPYPVCNECGSFDTEWVELSGDATVREIYEIGAAFTTPDMAKYAPLYGADVQLAEGPTLTCLVFGVTPENYPELREQVPLPAELVVLPKNGYNTYAVGINGAVPVAHEDNSTSDAFERLKSGHLNEKE